MDLCSLNVAMHLLGMFLDGSGVSFSSHPHHLPTISADPCPSFPWEWVTEHHRTPSSWNPPLDHLKHEPLFLSVTFP